MKENKQPMPDPKAQIRIGTGVHQGIAIGRALVVRIRDTSIFPIPIGHQEVEKEVQRFRDALDSTRGQLKKIRDRVREGIGESYSRLFDAQLLILEDASLVDETIRRIRDHGVNAEWALRTVMDHFIEVFAQMGDPYLRERGGDLEDVHRRVQALLSGASHHHDLSELNEDVIVVAPTLTPSETALLHRDHVIGFITDGGGPTSHTAILAEALGIPAVVGLHDFTSQVNTGDPMIIDAALGTVIHRPTDEQIQKYEERKDRLRRWVGDLRQSRDQPAVTTDGVTIQLMANIQLPEDVELAQEQGALGIGLYRSEFLFLQKSPQLPQEEDHYQVCRALAEKVNPHEAIVRTLDIGGEKYYHAVLERDEANPVMGLRAIRFCLRRKDIFRTQLRGILRASVHGKIRLMFPMISSLQEFRQARAVLEEVKEELRREGTSFDEKMPLGIMIEIPSAATIADLLAREVDFFSIGTNDLIQYCLAIDRGNESVAYIYEPFHPAILRMLNFVVDSAIAAGIPVGICGEMAGNPFSIVLLLGMGLRQLSMHSATIPSIKAVIRTLSIEESREILKGAMELETGPEIEKFIRARILDRLPDSLSPPMA